MADVTSERVYDSIDSIYESITLYSLKTFEDPLTRNKFKRSDMDIYMAYKASEGVYEYV